MKNQFFYSLFLVFFLIPDCSLAQGSDSYYRRMFKDSVNACSGLRKEAYEHLKDDIKIGMRYRKVFRRLPAEFHLSPDKSSAQLVLSTRCDGDEDFYYKIATYLVLDFANGKLVNIRLMNYG